jgi:hypothetical protein
VSRSNYSDDCEHVHLYRGAVNRALQGKRGQAFLREMLAALDELPWQRLEVGTLVELTRLDADDELTEDVNAEAHVSGCCAMGAVALKRELDVSNVNAYMSSEVGRAFDIAPSMAAEIAYENDEAGPDDETPEQRWHRVRAWVVAQIKAGSP